jgi:inorganic pyrophosphatase
MDDRNYPQEALSFQIQAYRKPKDIRSLKLGNVAFTGSPRKHPYDSDKVILVADPYSTNTLYFEFDKADVTYVEEQPSLVDLDGNTVTMIRLWLKKGGIAVRCTPFVVSDTRGAG